jgi:hypothetical protein
MIIEANRLLEQVTQAVVLLTYNREVTGSYLAGSIGYPGRIFAVFLSPSYQIPF